MRDEAASMSASGAPLRGRPDSSTTKTRTLGNAVAVVCVLVVGGVASVAGVVAAREGSPTINTSSPESVVAGGILRVVPGVSAAGDSVPGV